MDWDNDKEAAPEFINVRLADRDGRLLSASEWPNDTNLETTWMHDNDGRETHKESVIIPMGAVLSNGENYSIKLGAAGSNEIRLRYEHTVD
ncbi:hypothetical protein GQ600_2618 [Phytophthora cactorum]|nr:hypothetical protein GQ600_2618 [Phytophthora cactorum]